jgi:glycosyltransferase involved in cell wall biosynthesis
MAGRLARAGVPYCVTVHGILSPTALQRRAWAKQVAGLLERPFLNRAAFVHALTDTERADLRRYGVRAPIVVAPNGVDPDELAAPEGDEAPCSEHGPEFLYLGRLDPEQKGLDLLISGFARARLEGATLTLAGPDWRDSRARLARLAEQLGIASRVRFPGAVFGRQKEEVLRRAAVFVHTSRWEGLALSVLEAAWMAKPLLLTPAADPAGRFGPAAAALVIEPTPDSIAAGLEALGQLDPSARAAMGLRARTLVEATFAWPAVAQTLITAYREHHVPEFSR